MSLPPMREVDCQQDALRRIQRWLDLLEARLIDLLRVCDPELLKPNEREQAIGRNLVLVLRFLQMRQQQARSLTPDNDQALMDEILQTFEGE